MTYEKEYGCLALNVCIFSRNRKCFSCDQIWLWVIVSIGGMATPKKWQLLSLWSAKVSTRFCKHQKAWKERGPATRSILYISITPCVHVTRNYLMKTYLSQDINLVYASLSPASWLQIRHQLVLNKFQCSFVLFTDWKTPKNSKNINLPVGSLSHSWCFCCFQLNSSPSECTYLTPTQTHNSSLTTQTGKTFKIMTESRTRPNTSESTTIMMLACLISLGHLEHMGTLKAGPGEFEKDLEGKVPMGAYWTVISCHVDECCYEN